MYDEKEIQESYNAFLGIVTKLENKGLSSLIENLGENLVMAPASAQKDEYGCFPSGIINFALELAQTMRKLNVVGAFEVDAKSIYIVAFLRAIGEYGTSDEQMFNPHDSDWHIEKLGLLYKRNTNLNGTDWSQRAIELAVVNEVNLKSNEVLALLSADRDKKLNNLARLLSAATTIILFG
jgi:hypothetical protein